MISFVCNYPFDVSTSKSFTFLFELFQYRITIFTDLDVEVVDTVGIISVVRLLTYLSRWAFFAYNF